MRSTRFRYSILLFLGLTSIILNACAPGADPPSGVTPDTTFPSTLNVTVNIDENQNASDAMSMITLTFNTNEISEANYAIFTQGESFKCNGITVHLGNAASYWVRIRIPEMYTCIYNEHDKSFPIINVHKRSHLSPVLHVPVGNPFKITYIPDSMKLSCPIQAVANDAGNNIAGPSVLSYGNTYTGTGTDVSTLNGAGNIVMKRTCTWNLSDKNHGDNNPDFASVNITYQSTATLSVTWFPPNSPTQGTGS